MIPRLTPTGMSAINTIQQRAFQGIAARRAEFERAGWRYYYEPTCPYLPGTFRNGRPFHRGPHRFAHAMDIDHPNRRNDGTPIDVYGWLTNGQPERLKWCLEQFGFEGVGKRDRWTRVCGFQFTFQRDEDAFAFKMRWC